MPRGSRYCDCKDEAVARVKETDCVTYADVMKIGNSVREEGVLSMYSAEESARAISAAKLSAVLNTATDMSDESSRNSFLFHFRSQ